MLRRESVGCGVRPNSVGHSKSVYDIIRVSHNRNSKSGITGGLIFLDGYFLQILEGLPLAVGERFEHIKKDNRHIDILVRQDQVAAPILNRIGWGYATALKSNREYLMNLATRSACQMTSLTVVKCWRFY